MKKLYALILVTVLAGLLFGVTETHRYRGATGEQTSFKGFHKVTLYQEGTPPADATETLNDIYGVIDSIVIDAAGTDTTYGVILKDSTGNTLFTKTDCSTASDPYRFAVNEVSVDSKYFRGARVAGACTVELAGCDDSSMTSITVTIYYWQTWR